MADELSPLAVETYTQGRLHRDDPDTVRLLAAALRIARRYCGWHVAPVRVDDPVVLDGPGSGLLVLPTLRLVTITELTEDGVLVDPDTISVSARGLARKRNRGWWTSEFGGITGTMTHGFDGAEDFDSAVLSLLDRWSQLPGGGDATAIGPFQYGQSRESAGSAFTDVERFILDMYALEKAP